jgi:hypothetical protein
MEGALLLDVVFGKSAAALELLTSKDQVLLVRLDALLVLGPCLHAACSSGGDAFWVAYPERPRGGRGLRSDVPRAFVP